MDARENAREYEALIVTAEHGPLGVGGPAENGTHAASIVGRVCDFLRDGGATLEFVAYWEKGSDVITQLYPTEGDSLNVGGTC